MKVGNYMGKSIKIGIGILISALLFYLFIKDVNKVKLGADSLVDLAAHGNTNGVLTISEGSGLLVGDEIQVYDDDHSQKVRYTITEIKPSIVADSSLDIVVDKPLQHQYTVSKNAVIEFPRLQRALATAHYWWLVPALLLTLLALWIRAYRWKLFFPEHKKMKVNSLWISVCIGYMANNILPFRMGEIIRAWILGRKENRTISESFATIVMERVFDILSILILFVAFIFYFSTKEDVTLPSWLIQGAWLFTAISLIALGVLLALRFKTEIALKWVAICLKPIPDAFSNRIMSLFESFIEGLSIFSSMPAVLGAFTLSMVIWLDLAWAYYFMFQAVGIQATVLISMFLIVGLAFAVSIPSAPGFIGTFHYVGCQILVITGIKGNLEAYVLLAHAMAYIPVVVLGFLYLSLENLTFKDLKQSMVSHTGKKD
jgi:glycosyltransferase 2 family protein